MGGQVKSAPETARDVIDRVGLRALMLVIDVAVFGILEKRVRYELPFGDEKQIIQVIRKTYHGFKHTLVEMNI
jgi:hypothetical protein